jgi:adenine phosphoribosyltransferase
MATDHAEAAPLAARVRGIVEAHEDWPIAGVRFVDFLPLWRSPALLDEVVRALASGALAALRGETGALATPPPPAAALAAAAAAAGLAGVAGLEARGFLLGVPLAAALGLPFLPLRKAGKLPGKT